MRARERPRVARCSRAQIEFARTTDWQDRTHPTAAKDVPLHPDCREVGRGGITDRRVVGVDVESPHAEIAHLAGQPSAAQHRDGLSHLQSDPAAKLKFLVPLLPSLR